MMDLGPAAARTTAGTRIPRPIELPPQALRAGVPLLLDVHDLALTLTTCWTGETAIATAQAVLLCVDPHTDLWQAMLAFLVNGTRYSGSALYIRDRGPGAIWWGTWADRLSPTRARYGRKIRYPEYTVTLVQVQHAQPS